MALFDSGSPVANVALSDTFNTWRVRTNQINTQAAGLASNNAFTGTLNTFNNAVAINGPVTAPIVTANTFSGTLSGTASVATVATTVTLVATNTTDATHYPVFVDAATGNENVRTDTGFTYNPSSGILASTDFNSTSDITLKENLSPVQDALALINNLNGYTFDWKDRNRSSIGVTAQDVEKHLPQLVTEINNHKTVNYNGLIGVLIEAVKELNSKIESK